MQLSTTAMFFFSLLFFSGFSALQAQCTPLDSIPGTAIIDPLPFTEAMPENGLRDTACVGLAYETVLHIEVPELVNLGALGNLPIDSVSIVGEGITGVPTGFSFDCSSATCVFYPNEVSCIRIFGTPAAGSAGQYNLEVNVRIHSGIFNLDRTLPDPTLAPGEYRLFVRQPDHPSCQPSATSKPPTQAFSMLVAPNPSQGFSQLIVNAERPMLTQLRVFDAFGRLLISQPQQLLAGENRIPLHTQSFSAGTYSLVLQAEGSARQLVSSRLVLLPR